MILRVENNEIFGLIRPYNDVHSLGISSVGKILEDCGYKVIYGDIMISEAIVSISRSENISLLIKWIRDNKISRMGFSYRLDPKDAQKNFGKLYYLLKEYNLFSSQGGLLKQIYFAGLPESCDIITKEYHGSVPVFIGDETQLETLRKLGIPENKIPNTIFRGSKYDDDRSGFARKLIADEEYKYQKPLPKKQYQNFGTFKDTLTERIYNNRLSGDMPLIRVHVGPYNQNYAEAKKEFKSWLKTLAETGFLDIVSVGSSQLSQSNFGEEWRDKPNGGGVPINSEQDLYEIWEAARPMLVRTYAGTKNIPQLAEIYEKNINIAWHALSFWWFNQIDGRGPYSVKENLEQHYETLKIIAKTGKPFEPNIPHHFSFRGGDDYTYVLSAYLAIKTAKKLGVSNIVIQTMLNTPKSTWGVQDLAKARALLMLADELKDTNFNIFFQPRAGLDYFSPDLEKAKIQLAAVTAMMDDIIPDNTKSPDIIHVVSYCEAVKLATPEYINESIQITLKALEEYRKQKKLGNLDDMKNNFDVIARTKDIYQNVKAIVEIIEKNISDPYSPEGLYQIFKKGIMPVPYLWEGRDEFSEAVKWKTGIVDGGVKIVDENEKPLNPVLRVSDILNHKHQFLL
ncbi:MAG: hypothetical protein LBQ22_07885 [Bacteroidales bacterium]|jgi:hypothetical protein|nr:hypothetical protein [Bacteroidales bacterium]